MIQRNILDKSPSEDLIGIQPQIHITLFIFHQFQNT